VDGPKRSAEKYYADIRKVLTGFYQPGDVLTCTNHYQEDSKCQMCGGWVDIRLCYELTNERSKKKIICGSQCIAKYAHVVEQMNQVPVVNFPEQYKNQAALINRLRPNTVTVVDVASYEDHYEESEDDDFDDEERQFYGDLGLDPDDPDFEDLAPHGMEAYDGDDDEDDDDRY
jgi:hypothetical protein